MNRSRIPAAIAIAIALAAFSAQAADIVLTPPAGGSVRVTNAAGDATRFRIFDDGTVMIIGDLFKGGDRFLHTFGTNNTFLGVQAGNFTMSGIDNSASGSLALRANTTGYSNTATGRGAMLGNTTGWENTAHGTNSLHDNTSGIRNTAIGNDALFNNTEGSDNIAAGSRALYSNTTGEGSVAIGSDALRFSTGTKNTSVGASAMRNATSGSYNTAVGTDALANNLTGGTNVAIGYGAGLFITGFANIAIGSHGVESESGTIRIGREIHTRAFMAGIRGVTTGSGNAIPVMIDSNGQLGTVSSSGRFKDDIADMDTATDALMQLRPVTFHYKADQDPEGRTLQYGLVAEEVAEVYPGLVARSNDGQVETVMYQFLPSMLLNEVQKQRRTIERLEAKLAAIEQRLATPREPQ